MKTIEELTGYDKAAIIYDILGDSVNDIDDFKVPSTCEFFVLH